MYQEDKIMNDCLFCKIISGEIEVPTDKESFDAKYGDVYQLDD